MLSNKRHHVLFMQLITVSVKQKLCRSTISCKEDAEEETCNDTRTGNTVAQPLDFFLREFRFGYRYT